MDERVDQNRVLEFEFLKKVAEPFDATFRAVTIDGRGTLEVVVSGFNWFWLETVWRDSFTMAMQGAGHSLSGVYKVYLVLPDGEERRMW